MEPWGVFPLTQFTVVFPPCFPLLNSVCPRQHHRCCHSCQFLFSPLFPPSISFMPLLNFPLALPFVLLSVSICVRVAVGGVSGRVAGMVERVTLYLRCGSCVGVKHWPGTRLLHLSSPVWSWEFSMW